jgi:excisionase family DNA binding protein
MDKLLTVADLAERLNIAPGSIYHWVAQGRLPCIRFSKRCLRFRESEVSSLLDELSDAGSREGNNLRQRPLWKDRN